MPITFCWWFHQQALSQSAPFCQLAYFVLNWHIVQAMPHWSACCSCGPIFPKTNRPVVHAMVWNWHFIFWLQQCRCQLHSLGTFHSAKWKCDYSPDLCWVSAVISRPQPASCTVLEDFPHSQHRPSVIHVGLRLPVMRGIYKRWWNFRKADWPKYTAITEHSSPLIPMNSISIEETYQRFIGTIMKAAHFSILEDLDWDTSRVWMKNVRFCLTSLRKLVTQKLLTTWSSHWMLLDAVVGKRQPSRWILQSQVARADHSSDIWERLKTHQEQAVASHLLQVARALVNKKHKCRVQVEWRYFLRHAPDNSLPPAFTVDKIYQVLQNMQAGTAPGYDHVHPEFLKNLGPRGQAWLLRFFSGSLLRTQSKWKKRSERRKHCARAGCSKFRTLPACPLSQTHRQDRLQYTVPGVPQLASAQCKNLEKDEGNCDRETRKGPKTGGKLPPNSCLAHATSYWNVSSSIVSHLKSRNCLVPNKPGSEEIAALANRLQH